MTDEDIAQLQDQLAEARAEIDRLQVTAADREARAAHLEESLRQAREELASAQAEASARAEEVATLQERAGDLESQVKAAATRYREAVLQAAPDLPADLVAGETVEDVDRSLEAARQTVSSIRGHLESQAEAGRVPVGAPPRSAPDLSALSPADKIRFGLQRSEQQ